MFRLARIKLTAWYLVIIMFVSLSFSLAIYKVLGSELNRVERIQRLRQEGQLPARLWMMGDLRNNSLRPPNLDHDLFEETKSRLIIILALINLLVFGASAAAGYFLAGRTLKPIKEMVDEQSRFITDASHELRTPLTALKAEIEVNLRDKNLDIQQARNLLKSNLEEVNSMQSLTDDLLILSRPNAANGDLGRDKIFLDRVVDNAIRKVGILAQKKNIKIEYEPTGTTVFAVGNALTQVFIILLDNAIKYSNTGSSVQIVAAKLDSRVSVKFLDHGVGIKLEELPHIFDRFYRADQSRSESKTEGFGLGLSIAKKIIEEHGGKITAESHPQTGTVFTITLPSKGL